MNGNKVYRDKQLEPLLVKGTFYPKIKIRNPNNNSETFWLNITCDELISICKILDREMEMKQ
jgi:hypothetical protein